jgi:hypothetical protein
MAAVTSDSTTTTSFLSQVVATNPFDLRLVLRRNLRPVRSHDLLDPLLVLGDAIGQPLPLAVQPVERQLQVFFAAPLASAETSSRDRPRTSSLGIQTLTGAVSTTGDRRSNLRVRLFPS